MKEETAQRNPNGANATQPDPRQQVCWDFYIETVLANKPDAQASALKAGYEPNSAKNITLNGWFKDRLAKLKRRDILSKAEKVLEKTLSYDVEEESENGVRIKTDLLRIQTDVAKHVTSTLGKDEGYSNRVENTGKDGGAIEIQQITGMKIVKQ